MGDDEVPYEVEEDEDCGRYLVAARMLDEGEVIIVEKPTVHGLSRESCLVCFGCYGNLCGDDPKSCDFCRLPLCKNVCQTALQHQPECKALQLNDLALVNFLLDGDSAFLHEVVLVLRCLSLRQTNVTDWINFLDLESHREMRGESEMEARSEKVASWICENFANALDVDRETVMEICAIFDVNSFEVPVAAKGDASVQAVYANAGCLVEHNCIPSAHRSFGDDLALTLRAAVTIEKDEHISITYTDSLWTTVERRNHLMVTKYFECICLRCCDPTELDTYLSAIKCLKCTTGYLLPDDTLESSSEWQCEDCSVKVPAQFVENVNSQVAETVQLLELSGMNPEICKKFLVAHLRILHPQHAHMFDVKHSLLHILGHYEGYLMADLDHEHLQMKEDIARTILRVSDRILPGLSRLRGTTLYELFLTLQQRALNWSKPGRKKSPEDILSTYKMAKNYLSQCIETLKFEPPSQAEGKLLVQARKDYEMLDEHIARLS